MGATSITATPPHLPFKDRPFRHHMGVLPLALEDWIQIDEHYAHDVALREQLVAREGTAVLDWLPGTEDEAAEALVLLADHLTTRFAERFTRRGETLRCATTGRTIRLDDGHPMAVAARLTQEDLLLLVPRHGTPVLGAAAVCFPSRWDLPSKMGLSMAAIHAPVPGYAEQLHAPTEEFLGTRLTPERPAWRVAWSITDLADLHQPAGIRRPIPPTAADVADTVYYRLERETLRRLPRHDSILFTIRTSITPLRWFADRPVEAARMAAAIRRLPADVATYKTIEPMRDLILDLLEGGR
jgi:hypothetical protein